MKYECPFCKSKMTYHIEKQYFDSGPIVLTPNYLIHNCRKSKCKIGIFSKYKIWEYQSQIQGVSLILNDYKIVSRYDLNESSLCKVSIDVLQRSGGFNVILNKIIETDSSIKIELADPISSGLQVINRLMKLRAFS
jgi:hypothetical protein